MVSAFQDDCRGSWFRMTKEELDLADVHEILQGKQLLAVSPGLVFFDYCKGREGYWDALCFHNQTDDVLDCLEEQHPGWQPVLLCYWSSGHNGMGEGGLTTGTISGEGKMNLSYGGKQGDRRATTLTQGDLGPNPPELVRTVTITEDTIVEKPVGRGTARKKVQTTVQVHRTEPETYQLKAGDVQNLVFKEGDAAPWMQTLKPNDKEG